ncbi:MULTISPECIES: extracellular solute-binding protein [Enterococcus]|uniref:Sugar ABC transporter substrate-binding protein n=2 Tax=Enterococcus mundtii TaxID=53346 RepID=A0A2T5DBY0_ENTMU|nr:extracellular solute-binding protein [Enterococcus mundtii]MBE6173840.1 extracellular solute-binding protein [Enterococcus faecium]MBO1086573.1 extracellular solute-binding protein [Enterococcus mundtii]PQC28175.1 sugar ABC transporter substrate-binding protein [Enterococcus mundtii]PTO35206.1 sugar ABC transporter substrate-binding protein [Enterococcus mundtii]
MKKKTLVTAGIGLLSILALSACGNDSSDTSADTEDGKTRITWLNILHTASPPNDTIVDKIEEKTNTELTFNWIPDASKEERLTTALASNELGDIVTLQIAMLKNSSVRNALKSGVFWDVSDYLADYKNLSKISEDRIEAASIDGALYGVPMQKDYARAGLVIRKDWLDNLGLEVPDTLDELYEVAKQFTENDPDGNGVDDTVGFGDRAPSDIRYTSFKLFTSYYGAPNGWKVESNGKFTPEFDTDEYKKAMDFSRDLFENGYLAQDFAVTQKTDQQEQFAQGKTGIYTGMIDIKNLKNMGKDIQPEMELVPVNKISDGEDGDYHVWSEGNGVGGLLAFPKSSVKDEAQLKKLLQFVDDLLEEDMYKLMTGGIEGTHYQLQDDGAIEYIDMDLWQQEVQPLSSSRPSEVTFSFKDADPEKELSNQLVKENEQFVVLDPTVPLDSEKNNEVGSEIEKIMIDATVQYIMGQIDEDGFKQAISNWRAQGGDQIAEEYEEAYKAAQQ